MPLNKKVKFILYTKTLAPEYLEVLSALLHVTEIEVTSTPLEGMPTTFTPLGELYLSLTNLIDPVAEKVRIEKEIKKLTKDIDLTENKLENPEVMNRAPAEKVAEWQRHLKTLRENRERLAEQLVGL